MLTEPEERAKQLHPNNSVTLQENLASSEGTEIAGGFIKFVLCVEMLSSRSDFSHYLNEDTAHTEMHDACLTVTVALTNCTRNTEMRGRRCILRLPELNVATR